MKFKNVRFKIIDIFITSEAYDIVSNSWWWILQIPFKYWEGCWNPRQKIAKQNNFGVSCNFKEGVSSETRPCSLKRWIQRCSPKNFSRWLFPQCLFTHQPSEDLQLLKEPYVLWPYVPQGISGPWNQHQSDGLKASCRVVPTAWFNLARCAVFPWPLKKVRQAQDFLAVFLD